MENQKNPLFVLWVSRHPPLPTQIAELKRKLGNDIIITRLEGHIPSAEFVIERAKEINARVIVPVLPLSFIAHLVPLAKQHKILVLWAQMDTVGTFDSEEQARICLMEKPEARTMVSYRDGITRVYEFKDFRRIIGVKIETEEW